MLIDEKRKMIFIHIPKNAGKSIGRALLNDVNYQGKHSRVPIKYSTDVNWKKFAVIRDPYDRAISIFEYQKMMSKKSINLNIQRSFIKRHNPTFLEYLRFLKRNNEAFMEVHSRPQAEWLVDSKKRKIKNLTLIDFDNLDEDLFKFFKHNDKLPLKLNKVNVSDRGDFNTYYKTDESRNLILDLYEKDFLIIKNMKAKI